MNMKKHLYRFFGCALIIAAAVMSGHAENGIIETRNYKICQGDTITMDTRKTVVYSDTILYDTILVTDPSLDSIYRYVVNVYPPFLNLQERTLERGTSFVWHDLTISKAGTYEKVYKTVETHCDSIYRLIVRERVETKLTQTLCKGSSISFGNQTIREGGVYRDTMHFSDYDSITILTLNLIKPDTVVTTVRIPEGESWEWNGESYGTAGTYYTAPEPNRFGCDSLNVLQLATYAIDTIDTVVTICPSTTFTWHGMTKGQTGVYEYPGVRPNGDRVMYRLDLTVKELVYVDTLFTLCDEESVRFHGKTYVNAGEYYDAYTCDTTYRITVVKHPSQLQIQTGELDRTNPFIWRYVLDGEQKADTIWQPGVYEHTSHNETTGCNDTYRLILTKDETKYHFIENVTICESEPYNWRNLRDLNKQGIGQTTHYFDRYRTAADQDSIYELVLTVKPVQRTIRTIHFCGSIEWNGKTYTESTTIVDTVPSVLYSCDSISTTILSKAMPVTHKDTVVIVGGETLNWHGQTITTAGDYTDIHHSLSSCDTTFLLHVELTEPAHTIKTHSDWYSICQGDGQVWRDDTYYNSGIYYDTVKTAGGEIDSLYILYLTVNKVYDLTERVSFLSFPVTYRDSLIKQPGAYVFKYQSTFGCDSIITSYIDKDLYHDIQTVTICPGLAHIWDYDGEAYSVSGTYTKTEKTKDGSMDSVIHVLNLTVRYIPETYVEETICKGQTYIFGEESLTQSGVYNHTFHKTGGCDSVVTLSLNVLSPDTTYLAIQRTQGSTYQWGTETIYEPGMYFRYGTNRFGCDSVSILNFTYNQVDTIADTLTICPNELPFQWNGIEANQTNHYSRIEQQPNGNYIFYSLDLTVRNVVQRDTTFSICEGSSITYNGETYDVAGHYRTYISCDTLMNVHVNVNQQAIYETHGSVTDDHGYTWSYINNGTPDTKEFKDPGTYEFENPNPETGCNDIYRLILTKDESEYHFNEERTICEGDEFTWHGLSGLSSITGTKEYEVKYETRAGKDSIYHLTLTVLPTERTVRTLVFCDEITWNGKTYTEDAVVYDTTSLSNGCYRIERVNLDKATPFYSKEHRDLPQGSVFEWHKQTIFTDGTYYDRQTTIHGCDSIYELTVTIIPASPETNQYAIELSTCEGDTIPWRGMDIWRSGTYVDTVWKAGTGKTVIDTIFTLKATIWPAPKDTVYRHMYTCADGASIRYDGQDYYTDQEVVKNFKTIHGCDSIVKVFMHFNTATYLSRTDTIIDKQLPYTWTYQLSDVKPDTVITTAGTYHHITQSAGGCTNQEELILVVLPTYLHTLDTTICERDLPFKWLNGPTDHVNDELTESKQYEYRYESIYGTDSIYRLTLTIEEAPKYTERISICENKDTLINGKSYFDKTLYPVGQVFRDTAYYPVPGTICDSIVYYEITKVPQRHIIETRILHQNETIQWHGETIKDPISKTYTKEDEIDPLTGCEIIYQLRVVAEDRKIDTLCVLDTPYVWTHRHNVGVMVNDSLFASGLFTDTVYDEEGRILEFLSLDLTITPNRTHVEQLYLCEGDKETLPNGKVYHNLTPDSIYRDTIIIQTPLAGCDSTVYYEILQYPIRTTIKNEILREGDTIFWMGDTITQAITKTYTKDSIDEATGCKVVNQLRVVAEDRFPVTICVLDTPYVWKHMQGTGIMVEDSLYTTGLYTDTVRDEENFIIAYHTLDLTVKIPIDTLMVLRGCQPEGVTWNGFTYMSDTIFRDTLLTCDTLYTVKIKVDTAYNITIHDTICEHELPYVVGQIEKDSVYRDGWQPPFKYKTACGCDSIVNLHLTIVPDFDVDQRDSVFICEEAIKEKPLYIGDTVHPAFDPYREKVDEWKGKWIGIKVTNDTVMYNCDTTKSLHIIVRPHQAHIPEYTYRICKGDSVQLFWPHDTTWISKPGVYMDTVPTISAWYDMTHSTTIHNDRAYECDSVTRWFVEYADTLHEHLYKHIREGETFVFNDSILSTTGAYDSIAPYNNINGKTEMDSAHNYCKAVYTMHLYVEPVTRFHDTIEICHPANLEYTYTFADDHEIKFQTPNVDTAKIDLADSTKHLSYDFYDHYYNLTVYYKQQYFTQYQDTICEGAEYRFDIHRNNSTIERWLHTEGTYRDTLEALNGCDSVIELRLRVRYRNLANYDTVMITDRQIPYLWHHSWTEVGLPKDSTDTLRASGDYIFVMPSIHGCDSVDSLHFTVHQTHVFRDTIDVCAPINKTLSHTWSTGRVQEFTTPLADDSIEYADTLQTRIKYDSIYVLLVNFHRTYLTHVYDTICAGDSTQIDTYQHASLPKRFYKETGIYYDTIPSFNGCDSIIALHLQVWPGFPPTFRRVDVADADTPYLWIHTWMENGIQRSDTDSLSISGNYSRRLPNIHGCDSIDSLALYIHQTYHITDDPINICSDEIPYTWRGLNSITETGDYTYGEQTVDGFDSVHYVHINVWPRFYDTISASICEGDSLRWGLTLSNTPRFIYDPGTYNDTFPSIHGCDSIVVLRLNVYPKHISKYDAHIADVDTPYVWIHRNHAGDSIGVDSLYAAGKYGYKFESEYSCDSIDTLTLYIHNTYKFVEEITICERETPYTWQNRNDITQSGTYIYPTQTHDGYDSVYIATITVQPTKHEIITEKICKDNLPFDFHGTKLWEGGIYIDTLASMASGCDSIVELHLTVNDPYYHYERHDIYEGETYNFFGQPCTTGGTYTHSNTTPAGCDSITEILLVVHPLIDTTAIVCSNDLPFEWRNHWNGSITLLHAAGIYHDDTTYVNGERTFWSINLIVNEPIFDTIRAAVCEGTSYKFRGIDRTEPGIYRDTTQAKNGCDSITTLILTVNKPYFSTIREDILEGQYYVFYGDTLRETKTVNHNAHTPEGCDSTTVLQLVVHPMVDTIVTVCENELPFAWNNRWSKKDELYYRAGIYRNDTTIDGRKYFYGLQINVIKQVFDTIRAAVCEGTSYKFRGIDRTEPGIYRDTTQAKNGCDSITTLILTVNKPYFSTRIEHIFEGQQVPFFDTICSTTGTYYHYGHTPEGCDSTTVLQLYVHQAVDTVVNVCSNDLPYTWINKWNGNQTLLYTAGIYRNDTTYVNGERMFYGLKLVVNEPTSTTLYRSICEGSQYTFNGQLLSTAGEYRDTLRNATGCDSIVVLHLNVEPTYYNTIDRTIYEGDTVMFQDQTYSTAGVYPVRFTTATGCDSIIELRLTVNRLYDDSVTVCANELPLIWRGQSIYESGIYRDTVINSLGKETAIGLKVNVLPIVRASEPINKTICEGDFYKFGKNILTEQGTYYDTLTAANGCDSIVMLALTVIPVKYETTTKRIFEGDSALFNNVWYKESGVYEYRVTNNNGCTDTYQLILTVLKTFNVDTTAVICDSELPFIWRGIEYNETGDYTMPISWTDSSRVVKTLHLTVNKSFYGERNISICAGDTFLFKGKRYYENGTFNDTIPSNAGCDSIIKYIISMHPTYDKLFEKHISDKQPYVFHDRVLTLSGTYEWTGKTVHGCDSMEHLFLTVHPSYFRSDTFDLCQSDSINFPFKWRDENGQLILEISQSGTYTDSILTEYGFDSVRQAVVFVHPSFFINEQYEIGEGEHLKIHGRDISSPAIYYDTLRTIHGCDSIYHIVVNQKRTREFTWNKTICQGEYFDFFGRKLAQTGQYKYTSQYKDSVVTLNLTVNPVTYSEKRVVVTDKITSYTGTNGTTYYSYIHEGMLYDSLVLGNNLFTEQYVNQYGCDSIARLIIVVSTHYSEWTPMPLCAGSEIKIDGQVITEAGLYTFLRRSRVTGEMDSIWRVEVYDAPAYEFDVTTTLCDGDTLFFGDKAVTRGGKQDVILKTIDGCDSIFHVDITLFPSYKFDTTVTIFDYQTYTWDQNHQTYNAAGRYTKTFPTVHDCDSTFVLNLNVIQTIRQSTEYTICEGQEYTWRGKKYTIEGYYTDTVNDAATYQSGIYTLHLIVAHPTYIANATGGEICADDKDFQIAFTYTGAKPTFYSIYYDQAAKDQGFIDVIDQPFLGEDRYATGNVPVKPEVLYLNHNNYVKPGTYTMSLVLDNGVCGVSRADNIELVIKYPSWIIEQNWNDIVVPLKKELNGGYEFDQVEWFVNGVRQLNNGKGYIEYNFRDGDEVVMSAHRKGENRAYETCPLIISINPSIAYDDPILVYPTQAPRHAPRVFVDAPKEGTFEVIATTGLIVAHGNLNEGQTQITLPAISGIYFIRIHQGDDVTSHKVMIY